MVFSSVPIYLEHPNWHQFQQQQNHQEGSGSENPQLLPLPPPQGGGGSTGGSIKPGSMVDRARLAKIPQPEAGLKCPRCDSTNTKFCYFNNYSLTQPRHFCKTCRRYWTRGGALRNVPVGGGCRRNKRSKSNSSKSNHAAASAAEQQTGPKSTNASPSSCSTDISGHFPRTSSQLPFIATLQNLTQYVGGNIGGFQPQMVAAGGGAGQTDHMGFHIGNDSGHGSNNILSADQWRLPFLTGFDPHNNLYAYQSEAVGAPISSVIGDDQLRSVTPSSGITQLTPLKMEENPGLNLSRPFTGISENNYWGGNSWTEFSGLNSSSTTNLL